MMGLLIACFLWAYWPTLTALVATWSRVPDYSHGFFVVPLAVLFLWARRDLLPVARGKLVSLGLPLVVAAALLRLVSAYYYLEALDGWSIALWIAGVVWLFGGWPVVRWSLPSIVFLFFMVPLPYRLERGLSVPLQGIATKLSCWTLQTLGQPALAAGHTIILGSNRLEVEQACSGLRIFMGIAALAFAYITLVRRSWWERAILAISVVPIALFSNMIRIVATGLLYQYASGEAAKHFSHDAAGWVMVVLAIVLFAAVLEYLKRLVPEVELVDMKTIIQRGGSPDV
jgi:exosortase